MVFTRLLIIPLQECRVAKRMFLLNPLWFTTREWASWHWHISCSIKKCSSVLKETRSISQPYCCCRNEPPVLPTFILIPKIQAMKGRLLATILTCALSTHLILIFLKYNYYQMAGTRWQYLMPVVVTAGGKAPRSAAGEKIPRRITGVCSVILKIFLQGPFGQTRISPRFKNQKFTKPFSRRATWNTKEPTKGLKPGRTSWYLPKTMWRSAA